MKTVNNLLMWAIVSVFLVMGTAFASPINVEDITVQEDNNDYLVLVTLNNVDTSTGVYSPLRFTVEELGTTVSKDVVVDQNDSKTVQYNLRDVVANFDQLKKGEVYTLNVSTNNGTSMQKSFLFGSEKDTEGLSLILERVELNNNIVTDIDTLQVLNGNELTLKLRLTAQENFDDARIRASIDGYEHGIIDASTEIFEAKEGVTYTKELSFQLPADMDSEKEYKLRIIGANDLSGITYKDYNLYVDTQRHRVDVLDLVMTPSSGVEPGQNLIANVRLKNRGQKEQDSVKVEVSIPELGVSESSYVSNLNNDEVVTSDDMLLLIPDDVKPGQYQAEVTLSYNDGYTQTSREYDFTVLKPETVPEKNLMVSFKDNVDLKAGQETSFEVVIANPNQESKPISLSTMDSTWADVEVTPTLNMIQGGSSSTYTVTVSPREAIEGERTLKLFVKEGAETVSEVSVNTYVEPTESVDWVNIALAVLLVIAIIILIALVITIARRKSEGGDGGTTEEYY